jgi:hypothetical protein
LTGCFIDLREADLDRALEVDSTARTLKRASQDEETEGSKRFANFHTRPIVPSAAGSDKSRRDSFLGGNRRRRSTASGKRPDMASPAAGASSSISRPHLAASMSASSPGPSTDIFDPHALFGLPQTNFSNAQSARSTSILGLPPTQHSNAADRPAPSPSFDALFDSIVGNVPGGGVAGNGHNHYNHHHHNNNHQTPPDFAADGLMPGVVDTSQSAFFGLPLSADPSAEDW